MANSTTGGVWKLDTAAVLTTAPIKVKKMVWTPTTAGHDIDVQDNSTSSIWSYKTLAGDTNQRMEMPGPEEIVCNGFNLVTIDGGTLWVYF